VNARRDVVVVRVGTFNIQRATAPDGRVSLRGLGAAGAALDCDVLGLQEVDRHRRRSRLRDESAIVARRVGGRRVFGPARVAPRRRRAGRYGNALVVRGALDEVEVRELPGTGTRAPRSVILARATVRGAALSVGVTHLQHHPKHLQHLADEAPEQLEAALALLRERAAPRVLLGDFNLGPERAEPILAKSGFTAAVTGPTYPAHEPTIRLDYIAVDGAEVAAARVGPRQAVGDHLPVVAELMLSGSLP
jgi:endonuclease/exonuclease/phosphatase family metal-dependent hydrolase